MKKYGKFTYFHCIILLKFASELGCFVCICILCGLSAKNPFENHIIGDLSTYFTDVKNITNNILSGPKFKVANKRNLSLGNDMEKKIFLREKGDIEVYDDFLECKNVRSKFFKKFSDIEHLRRTFIAFLIMNIIVQGIDKNEKCFENAEKAQQVEEENSNIF